MERPESQMSGKAVPEDTGKGIGAFGRWLVRAFPWHLRGMLVGNAALSIANAFTGGPWWAFWPLLATGFLLAVHFLFCKTVAVDDRWVEERVEELNLKSYDRSHIENLKGRHRDKSDPGADNRS